MKPKRLDAIEEKLRALETAYGSLRAQVEQAVAPEQKALWEQFSASVQEEINQVRKSAATPPQSPGFFETVEKNLEGAEHVVFKAFGLASTLIAAGMFLSHEIGPLEKPAQQLEPVEPTQKQEEIQKPTILRAPASRSAEPVPESLQRQREEFYAEFERLFGPLPDAQVAESLTLEKISEPRSVTTFVKACRTGSQERPAPRTFVPLIRLDS